jgi:hypothetical protein
MERGIEVSKCDKAIERGKYYGHSELGIYAILSTLISEQQMLRDRCENISVHSLVADTEGVGLACRVAELPGLDIVMEVGYELLPRRPELSFKGR